MAANDVLHAKAGKFFYAVNKTTDQLTQVAQSLLCIPSLLGNFLTRGQYGKLLGAAATGIFNAVQTVVSNAISFQLNRLTGEATAFVNDQIKLIAEARAVIDQLVSLFGQFASAVTDVRDFVSNCLYAASELASCIAHEAVGNINKKTAKAVNEKLGPAVNDATQSISDAGGTVSAYVDRNLDFFDKAREQIALQNTIR